MQFNTKNTKENANTKATKNIFYSALCINLCVLCVKLYFKQLFRYYGLNGAPQSLGSRT